MASIQYLEGMELSLGRITGAVKITAVSLGHFEQAAEQAFSATRLQAVVVDYDQMKNAVADVKNQQDRLNDSVKNGKKEITVMKKIWGQMSGIFNMAGINTDVKDIFAEAAKNKTAENSLQAKTGLKGNQLEQSKQGMENLYTDGFGASMEDVAGSMSQVYQITGQTGDGLEQLTRAGLLLRDTYGYDIAGSLQAVEMLERQFGVSGAEAFDLIIQGTQMGLNKNGNLLDFIKEYSPQFSQLGLDSTEMFNMLGNGAQNGMYSMEQIGNSVKEFSARVTNGSESTLEGFRAIGLNGEQMAASFSSGGDAARQAFQQTLEAISQVDDPISRNIAGVNLFGSMWNRLGYDGVMALADVNGAATLTTENLDQINQLKYDDATSALASLGRTINTGISGMVGSTVDRITKCITDFTAGLQGKTSEIGGIFGGIGYAVGLIGNVISDNWSIIEPIMWGILGILGIYALYLGYTSAVEIASLVIKGALAVLEGIHALAIVATTSATWAQATAQLGLNGAMYACPLVWIIGLLIAVIAIVYAIVAAYNQFAGTSVSATGVICGAISAVAAVFANVGMGIIEIGMGVVEYLINRFITFANFFANFLNDPVSSIIYLFAGLADGVLGIMEKIAQAIDFVFGSNLAESVSGWRDGLSDMASGLAEKWGNGTYEQKYENFDVDQVMAEMGIDFERFDYGENFNNGYNVGEGWEKNTTDILKDLKGLFRDDGTGSDIPVITEGIYNNTGDTAGNTASMTDSMDMMDEELKYMRDAAEQEIINRFTLAELKVDVKNNNTLNSQMDLDDVSRQLGAVTGEILASAAEGGHF